MLKYVISRISDVLDYLFKDAVNQTDSVPVSGSRGVVANLDLGER